MDTTSTSLSALIDEQIRQSEKLYALLSDSAKEFFNMQTRLFTSWPLNLFQPFASWYKPAQLSLTFEENGEPGKTWKNLAGVTSAGTYYNFFEQGMKQLERMNSQLLSQLTETARNTTWKKLPQITEAYHKLTESRLSLAQKTGALGLQAFNQQLDCSRESNRKLFEDINLEYYKTFTQYQRFWAELLSAFTVPGIPDKPAEENSAVSVKSQKRELVTA